MKKIKIAFLGFLVSALLLPLISLAEGFTSSTSLLFLTQGVPAAGDETSIPLYLGIMVFALLLIFLLLLLLIRRKKREEEE